MKKVLLFFLSSILLSCSSAPKALSNSSFEKVAKLVVGASQKKDVASLLGKPSEVVSSESQTLWKFNAPDEGQLITITFKNNSEVVHSILWVTPPDTAMKMEDLNTKYHQLALKTELSSQENPHSTNSSANLVDEKLGLSVLYHKTKNRIEAVAWFDPNQREPSAQRTQDNIQYKIDR